MKLFTQQQTPLWQRDYLAAAARHGDLSSLVWFIQMIMPPLSTAQRRTMTQAEQQDYRYRTACGPGAWVPYVEVAPDPERSRIDAELLAGIFAAYNPAEIAFVPALCLRTELVAVKSYEWGSEWDHVCSRCGNVFTSTVAFLTPLCMPCVQRLYRMAMY